MFDQLDYTRIGARADVWEKVVQKLRSGTMPPQGVRRPDPAAYHELAAWLEESLDRAAAEHPNPGRPLLHRLNRTEYANAVRDLLGLPVDVDSLLPPDESAFGFDNVSDVLGISPLLLERYLTAAGEVSALAVGDPGTTPGSATFSLRQDLSQDQHIEGLPLGTVGGTLVRYYFPLDADYDFSVSLFRTNQNATRGMEYRHQLEVSIDDQRLLLANVGGDEDLNATNKNPTLAGDAIDARLHVRVPVNAGLHAVAVDFLARSHAVGTVRLQPFLRSSADTFDSTGVPHIKTLTITGPFDAKGPGDTPSRRRVFVCHPVRPVDEVGCATRILRVLARRAYRRPITAADLDPLLAFYRAGRAEGTFESGIEAALQRLLASPNFVFRAETDPPGLAPGTPHRVTDLELASRLSFFLWSSIPDDRLLQLAASDRLHEPAVLEREVRRMLADSRSDALVTSFAGQWLQLRNLDRIVPNTNTFPDFDDNLRQAFRRETELFFGSIVREDRNVVDLMTADYTFLNERLARHYGIANVFGSYFRRVEVNEDARRGLLGKGSVLLVTSHADRTSPVVRGKWILENILGAPPPPPPPNVPPLKDAAEGEQPRTLRAQMEEHRKNAVCASCHKVMDPIGFSMENFDAVGRWRAREAGQIIDASGQLADGTPIDGIVRLRDALVKEPDLFVGTLTRKLMIYALGRGLEYYDMPAVRSIVRTAAFDQYRFSSIVLGIVNSPPFRMRMASPIDDVSPPPTRTAAHVPEASDVH